MQAVEAKGPRKEAVIRNSDFPLLKKKALELPNPGEEEKAFQQKKQEFLCGKAGGGSAVSGAAAAGAVASEAAAATVAKSAGIYGSLRGAAATPNYDFSSEPTSAFQQQFGILTDAFINFAKQHQAELDTATQELKTSAFAEFAHDYKFTPTDLKQLENLKVKMSSVDNVHGLVGIGEQIEQQEISNFFKKIKQQLEEVLFVVTSKLQQLPPGDTRTATLKSIAATLNTIARASERSKCTEGTSTLIESVHSKWCGKKEVGGWLLNFRQKIVDGLANEYLERRAEQKEPVSRGYETHVPSNYRRKARELGIGIPAEALKQDPYAGERETTAAAAEADIKTEFPKRYHYDSVCEYVARELAKKVLDFLATVGDADTPLQEAQTEELLKLTAFLMDERICRKADIISEMEINGVLGEKVNPYFRQQLLGYCMEYAPTLLAAEGYIDDIGQFRYQVLVIQRDESKSKGKSKSGQHGYIDDNGQFHFGNQVSGKPDKEQQPILMSLPLDNILERKLAVFEDVDIWQVRGNGDNLLTDALRCGEIFKFIALLRKGKLPITSQTAASPASVAKNKDAKQKPPSERQFDPLARNAEGLTPLAFIIGNPKKVGASSRCLEKWQQRLALQVLLQQPSMTFEEVSRVFSAENTALRISFSNDEDCPIDVFSLFFEMLVVKARQSLCLRIGREEAGKDQQRFRLIQQGILPKMELFEVAQLGDEKLKSLEPAAVEAKMAGMLKQFVGQLKIVELLVQQASYKKLHHLLLIIPGLDITGIDPDRVSERNISSLLLLLKHINDGQLDKACYKFCPLVSQFDQKKNVLIYNPLAYKNLLKIIANQCPDIQRRNAFIKAMAAQETDLTLRCLLAEAAPEKGLVQLSTPQQLRLSSDAKVVTETPLRLLLQTETKDKSLQLQRVKTLVECDANPFLPGVESAFTVAISDVITDPTHQERVIKLLLKSHFTPDAIVLLPVTCAGQSTYKSFTLLWDLAKQSMMRICEGQLGLAYAAFLAKEQTIILQQWEAVQLGQIAPAQRSALLESIIENPYQDAKELLAAEGDPAGSQVDTLQRFLEWAQTNKSERREKFKQQWLAKQFVITPAQVIAAKTWEDMSVHDLFVRAKASLGSEYNNFIKMIPATCATQPDAQGHSVLHYLVLNGQMDKLEKLLLDVDDLNLASVLSIPGILTVSTSEEVLTPEQQQVRCLIQLIHALRHSSPNYQYAKQLFLQLTDANPEQYQRFANILSKQCQQHHQPFFAVLMAGEENINVLWVMRDYVPLDMGFLPLAVKQESSLKIFTQYCDAVIEEADAKGEPDAVDVVIPDVSKERKQEVRWDVVHPASVPARTAAQRQNFCTALKTLIDSKGKEGSTQLEKLEQLLVKVKVMDELQASYPKDYQNLVMTPIDALVNLLMAIQSQQWPLAMVYLFIYIRKNAAVDDIAVKLEKIIDKQCGAKLLAVFNEKVTAENSTPSQFFLVHRAIVGERCYGDNADFKKAGQLLWEIKEGAGLDSVPASSIIRDLSLMIQLHVGMSLSYYAAGRMHQFCQYLVKSCRDEQQQRAIILCMVERYRVQAADCFFNFVAHGQAGLAPPQLLPEAELMSRLTAFADQMRAQHFPATVIKAFYQELCSLLVPEKCSYERYPKLIRHFLEIIGYGEQIFTSIQPGLYGESLVKETPLFYFMRTQNFVEVEKIFQADMTPPLDVDNGSNNRKTVLMCTMDIKDEKQRNTYVRQLLQRGAKVEAEDYERKNALFMAVDKGHTSTALILIEHVSTAFAREPYRINWVFHRAANGDGSSGPQHSAFLQARQSSPMQTEIILAMMQYMPVDSGYYPDLIERSPSAEFTSIIALLKKTTGWRAVAITRKDFNTCLPADYKVAEQTAKITRLLTIITKQVERYYYKTFFAELLEEYLQPPRVQDRALLTLLARSVNDHDVVGKAVREGDVDLLELALTKEIVDSDLGSNKTALWRVVNNVPVVGQPPLDEKTQQKMVDLLLAHQANMYQTFDSWRYSDRPSICKMVLQDRCHFFAFLSLVEHDSKNELLQPGLLSELKGLTRTSTLAQQKFQVLALCQYLQSTQDAVDPAIDLLQTIIAATTDLTLLLRILQTIQKKSPAGKLQSLLRHYIISHPSLSWELLQLFFHEFKLTMNGEVADPLLHYLIKNPTTENYARIQLLSSTPAFDAKRPNGRGLTPLMLLVQHFSYETRKQYWAVVEMVLPTSDISAVCQQKMTALMYAAQNPVLDMQPGLFVLILTKTLEHDPSNPAKLLNQQNKAGHTALRCAAEKGSVASVKKLLETKGIDAVLAGYQGVSPIEAAQQAKRDVVVDAFFAADQDERIAKSLLAQYQQQQAKSSPALKQLVAKILAHRYQHSAIALTELPHQDAEWAQLFIQQLALNFAAFFAVKAQYSERVKLLQHLGQCDQVLFAEGTPVHYALKRGDAELISQLLEIKTLRTTEADWQLVRDNKSLQRYAIPVLEKMVAVKPLPSKSTALILAVQQGDLLVCQAVWRQAKTLLDAKREWTEASATDGSFANAIALLNHKDQFGKSALYYAVEGTKGTDNALVVWLLSLPGIDKRAYCAIVGLSAGLLASKVKDDDELASLFAPPAILAAESGWHTAVTRAGVDNTAAATAFRACLTALDDQEDAQAILLSQLTQVQSRVTPPQYGALCHEVLSGLKPTVQQHQRFPQLYRELYPAAFTHQAKIGKPAARQSAITYFEVLVERLQCRDDVLLPLLVGAHIQLYAVMLEILLNAGRLTVARALLASVGVQFASEQELKATVVFRLLAQIPSGEQNSIWKEMILRIIIQREWQTSLDQVDQHGKTVLMRVVEKGLLSLFEKVLAKTKPETLTQLDKDEKSVLSYAVNDTVERKQDTFVQPLMQTLQKALKQYQVRIQQCQQFANPQQVEQRIAELKTMQTSLQAEEQLSTAELKDMDKEHLDYKTKSTKQSRLLRRVGEIGKEIATLDAIAKDHGLLRVLCEQAKNIAIVLLQYPQYLENSGATADAKLTTATAGATPSQPIPSFVEIAVFLLKVWRDPSTTNFTYLKSCYQYLQKFPTLAAMNELLFSIVLVLGQDRALPVQWIIQDVTHQSLGAAMQKFIVMFQFLNNDPKDGTLCFAVSSMKVSAITDASAAGADFCNQLLERIGIQALAAQRFALLKVLIAPVKMPGLTLSTEQQRAADAEPARHLRLLQQAISLSAPQFSAEVLTAMRQDEMLSMLVPSILSASSSAKQNEFKQLMQRITKSQSTSSSESQSSLNSLFTRGRVLAMEFVNERIDGVTPKRSTRVAEVKGLFQEFRQERRDSLAGRKSMAAAAGPGFIQGVSAAAVQQAEHQDPRYQALLAMKTIFEAASGTAPLDLSSLQPHRGEISKSSTLTEIDAFLQQWSAWQTAQTTLQPAAIGFNG